jgi:hypothetical protein
MKRRTFLASTGIGLTTAVAGCTTQAGSSDSPPTDSETPTSEDTQTNTEQQTERTHVAADGTVERTIGAESLDERGLRTPHHVAFGNPTAESHQGTVTVSTADEAVFKESVELEPNASIVASLTDLDTYTARVSVPELDATEKITVEPSQFTCKVTKTTISVQDDGTLDSLGISTRMACQGVVSDHVAARESASETLGDDPIPADTGKGSHTLMLRNPSEETWTTRILVEKDSTAHFDAVYTVEPEGTVLITLSEPDTYSLSVGVLETETTVTEQVTPENFDCNRSSTRAEIDDTGDLTASTVSTLMACDLETNSTSESP